jgi:hypothetical protein
VRVSVADAMTTTPPVRAVRRRRPPVHHQRVGNSYVHGPDPSAPRGANLQRRTTLVPLFPRVLAGHVNRKQVARMAADLFEKEPQA